MGKDYKEYKNLIGLLLGPIRQRPAMYLGEYKISMLPNFIFGYNMGFYIAKNNDVDMDAYFDECGFLEWFYKKYNIEKSSFWITPFLEEAKNDEKKALDIYFKYLDEYQKATAI